MTMNDRNKKLIDRLKDKAYRDSFVVSHIYNGIAFQIKAIREQKEWTQKELGDHAGNMQQERISVLENPNNSSVTINTLRKIASAFDVALMVRFVPFSDLVKWDANLSAQALQVTSFDEDTFFKEEPRAELKLGLISEALENKVVSLQGHKDKLNDKNSALQQRSHSSNEQPNYFNKSGQNILLQNAITGGR